MWVAKLLPRNEMSVCIQMRRKTNLIRLSKRKSAKLWTCLICMCRQWMFQNLKINIKKWISYSNCVMIYRPPLMPWCKVTSTTTKRFRTPLKNGPLKRRVHSLLLVTFNFKIKRKQGKIRISQARWIMLSNLIWNLTTLKIWTKKKLHQEIQAPLVNSIRTQYHLKTIWMPSNIISIWLKSKGWSRNGESWQMSTLTWRMKMVRSKRSLMSLMVLRLIPPLTCEPWTCTIITRQRWLHQMLLQITKTYFNFTMSLEIQFSILLVTMAYSLHNYHLKVCNVAKLQAPSVKVAELIKAWICCGKPNRISNSSKKESCNSIRFYPPNKPRHLSTIHPH